MPSHKATFPVSADLPTPIAENDSSATDDAPRRPMGPRHATEPTSTITPSADRSPISITRGPQGLIVTSRDAASLDQLMKLIDELSPNDGKYHLFSLKHSYAKDVAYLLEGIFKSDDKKRNTSPFIFFIDEPPAEEGLAAAIERHLAAYFASFGDDLPPPGLYHRVLREIEQPLLSVTLAATRGTQIRASEPYVRFGIRETTLPRPETSQVCLPRCSTATEASGRTRTRRVCGKARSYSAETTVGSASIRRSSAAPSSPSRLVPRSGASIRCTCRCTSGGAPTTSTRPIAKAELWRATP